MRALAVLVLVATLSAAALKLLEGYTAERTASNRLRSLERRVERALVGYQYDELGLRVDAAPVVVAGAGVTVRLTANVRRAGREVARVFEVHTRRGYNGDLALLCAVEDAPDRRLIAVDVLEHHETPGLGDRIEPEGTDFLQQFSGLELGHIRPVDWEPRRRGGRFDAITGATVTSRAVIRAVLRALETGAVDRRLASSAPTETK